LTYESFFDALTGLPVGRQVATPGGARRRRNKPRRAMNPVEWKHPGGERLRTWSKALRSGAREAERVGNDANR
jgi:hypothetical protein